MKFIETAYHALKVCLYKTTLNAYQRLDLSPSVTEVSDHQEMSAPVAEFAIVAVPLP